MTITSDGDHDSMWVTVITPESMARDIIVAAIVQHEHPETFGLAPTRWVSRVEMEKMYPRREDDK